MPATVRFIRGPAGAGKTRKLLGQFQATPEDVGLWIGPTERACVDAALRIGRSPNDPSLVTLAQLARKMVRSSGDGWRMISDAQQRLILAEVIESARKQKELRYYADAADRPGFVEAVLDWIVEIAGRGVTPEAFSGVVRRLAPRTKNDDIETIIDRYYRRLREHRLLDRELVNERAVDCVRRGRLGPFRSVQFVFVDGFVDFTPLQSALLLELAERVQEVTIALPGEPAGSNQQELFQRPERVLQLWQTRFHPDVLWVNRRVDDSESDKPVGLVTLSERLFQSPAAAEPASRADGLHMISAPGDRRDVDIHL
jgi:ATP-dependent helicase/DNAse subunit B